MDKARQGRGVKLLVAVSCASRRFCMAVGGRQAVAYRAGVWQRPVRIDPHSNINTGLVMVSCASARLCAARDGVGETFIYNGRRWLGTISPKRRPSCAASALLRVLRQVRLDCLPPIPGGAQALQTISCPSLGFCMELDITNSAYRLSRRRWVHAGSIRASSPAGGSEPNVASAISCSSGHFCAALDDFGEAFIWTGRGWSRPHTFDRNLLAGGDAISCPSKTTCMAVDYDGVASAWNGITWSPAQRIDASHAYLSDVSCPTARFCIAIDQRARAVIYR
jgi:hypothetical protein